jgi:hypothetical protein
LLVNNPTEERKKDNTMAHNARQIRKELLRIANSLEKTAASPLRYKRRKDSIGKQPALSEADESKVLALLEDAIDMFNDNPGEGEYNHRTVRDLISELKKIIG